MAETMPAPSEDPEPTLRGFMTGVGEVDLAFARWEHPEPRGRVVISHGYGEHGERYRHTAGWLLDQGWSVSTMDHRGFGRSGGIRGDAAGIRGSVEDLTLFLRQERMHDAGRPGPQILLGHSFGGLVALLVLLWHPETLEAVIVSSPALKLRELPLPLKILQTLFTWVAPHRPLDLPGNKALVCSDPVMVQRYLEDPLCHRFVSGAARLRRGTGPPHPAPGGGPGQRDRSRRGRSPVVRGAARPAAASPAGRLLP
jgi:alpha-beta hydrolase superfamily lysophospholipase